MAIMARWQAMIVDDAGNVQPDAFVEVRREMPGSPLVSIYSDRDGAVPLGNPFQSDSEGFAAFHVLGGAYRITATKDSFSRVWRYVGIGNASEQDGIASGVRLRFNDETDDSDPGRGYLKFDNADLGSVTEIYVSDFGFLGFEISAFLDTFQNGGIVSNRGLLTIQSANEDGFFVGQITGNVVTDGSPSTYRKLSVTPLAFSEGSFVADDIVGIAFNQAGGGLAAPVSFTDIQQINTTRLLGRQSADTGVIEQLTLSQALDLIGSVAEGDILYRDTSAWQRLPRGTEGQYLRLASEDSPLGPLLPAWRPADQLVTAVERGVLSSQPTLDIDLSGGADMYEIELMNITPAFAGTELYARFSQSSTFLSGASDYSWGYLRSTASAGDASDSEMEITIDADNATVTLRIRRPSASSFLKTMTWQGGKNASGSHQPINGSGALEANIDPIDGVQFFYSTGNISSGFYAVRAYSFN